MGGLKDELLKAIWHAFTALDLDRSGKVSKSQLKVGSRLPALPQGNGTRGEVRREGWLGSGGAAVDVPPSGLGRCAGAGALRRLPRRLHCAQRGAAGPEGRPHVRGGGEPGSLRLVSGTRSRAFPPGVRRAWG